MLCSALNEWGEEVRVETTEDRERAEVAVVNLGETDVRGLATGCCTYHSREAVCLLLFASLMGRAPALNSPPKGRATGQRGPGIGQDPLETPEGHEDHRSRPFWEA